MTKITDVVIESLEVFNASVVAEIDRKGLEASGRARNSLEVVQRGDQISSVGIDYIKYLDQGRAPGKFPPMAAIARWVDLKGLKVDPYVIARGIAEQGTRIYRDRSKGLMLEEKTQVLQEQLNEKLPKFISDLITTELNKAFKGR